MSTPDPIPDPRIELADYYGRVMRRFVDVGANIVEQLDPAHERQADPETNTPSIVDIAHAYDVVTRSVRRSVLSAMDLAAPIEPAGQERRAARRQIVRAVDETIADAAPDPEQAASLRAELRERIDGPDIEDSLLDRPLYAIVNDISRDLGLVIADGQRLGLRRTPEDIALLNEFAAAPPGTGPTTTPPLPRVTDLIRPARRSPPAPLPVQDHGADASLTYMDRKRQQYGS